MNNSAAGIVFSSLNNNTLSRLTGDRTVSAIPFACRYRLIDFCLSNLVNANISTINIVANYNYRSLVEHIGSGKDWDLARREKGINVISPYQTAKSESAKVFSTHMEALISIREYIDEFKENYVVLMDSDHVLNIDLRDVIERHRSSGAQITLVTKKVDSEYSSKHPRIMIHSNDGIIDDISMSASYTENNPELCLNIFVTSTVYLKKLIEEAIAYNLNSLTGLLCKNYKNEKYMTYCYNGYVATVSSFLDYYRCSIELATDEEARQSLLYRDEAPIYTRVHNSSPVVYRDGASVVNSMVADECVIEGTVINSVVFRNVRVDRGAVVKNSILFSGTHVGERADLNCIVTDKKVYISDGVVLSGHPDMPFYIQKGKRL